MKCVLEAAHSHVHATVGNFNNHIGVPLTLLAARTEPDIAIIEMGANAQKEIALLAEIAEPNAAVITNIGRAHLEGFGGEEGVMKGKGELFDYIRNARPESPYSRTATTPNCCTSRKDSTDSFMECHHRLHSLEKCMLRMPLHGSVRRERRTDR